MRTQVTRDEFLKHLAALFDGETDIPCTYTWDTEITLHGETVETNGEGYETFAAEHSTYVGQTTRYIEATGNGRRTFIPITPTHKTDTFHSLLEFLDRQPDPRVVEARGHDDRAPKNLRYFIGEKRGLSLWAHFPRPGEPTE
jgi:hypothetical protein